MNAQTEWTQGRNNMKIIKQHIYSRKTTLNDLKLNFMKKYRKKNDIELYRLS